MDPHASAQSYALLHMTLKAEWFCTEPRLEANTDLLREAASASERLAGLAPADIAEFDDRRAFWINIYNGAVIEQAVDMGVKTSVREVRGFFRRRFLEIAGTSLSLDEIEHGLLRDNRRHPARLLPALVFRPKLKPWIARPFDPRIHFALNCGARSCPPIAVYTFDAIEAQLDLAASTFLDGEVEVDSEAQTIDANPILRWYRSDFGDLEELIDRHRSGGLAGRDWTFRWRPYDWSV